MVSEPYADWSDLAAPWLELVSCRAAQVHTGETGGAHAPARARAALVQ